jgi:hypothetical protein
MASQNSKLVSNLLGPGGYRRILSKLGAKPLFVAAVGVLRIDDDATDRFDLHRLAVGSRNLAPRKFGGEIWRGVAGNCDSRLAQPSLRQFLPSQVGAPVCQRPWPSVDTRAWPYFMFSLCSRPAQRKSPQLQLSTTAPSQELDQVTIKEHSVAQLPVLIFYHAPPNEFGCVL